MSAMDAHRKNIKLTRREMGDNISKKSFTNAKYFIKTIELSLFVCP